MKVRKNRCEKCRWFSPLKNDANGFGFCVYDAPPQYLNDGCLANKISDLGFCHNWESDRDENWEDIDE